MKSHFIGKLFDEHSHFYYLLNTTATSDVNNQARNVDEFVRNKWQTMSCRYVLKVASGEYTPYNALCGLLARTELFFDASIAALKTRMEQLRCLEEETAYFKKSVRDNVVRIDSGDVEQMEIGLARIFMTFIKVCSFAKKVKKPINDCLTDISGDQPINSTRKALDAACCQYFEFLGRLEGSMLPRISHFEKSKDDYHVAQQQLQRHLEAARRILSTQESKMREYEDLSSWSAFFTPEERVFLAKNLTWYADERARLIEEWNAARIQERDIHHNPGSGKIVALGREMSQFVLAQNERYEAMRRLVNKLDVQNKQILLNCPRVYAQHGKSNDRIRSNIQDLIGKMERNQQKHREILLHISHYVNSQHIPLGTHLNYPWVSGSTDATGEHLPLYLEILEAQKMACSYVQQTMPVMTGVADRRDLEQSSPQYTKALQRQQLVLWLRNVRTTVSPC